MFLIDTVLLLGILAGILQFYGYVVYIRDTHIDPNPITWFMFAYGTILLTVLEWDSNATFSELILPSVCSVMAIYVSFRCWRVAIHKHPNEWWPREWWPDNWQDKFAFQTDIALTAGYIIAWTLAITSFVSPEDKALAVLFFLITSNLSTISSFYPLLRSTFVNPSTERAYPWLIWTLAYAVLIPVTYLAQGTVWHELMLYPVLNTILHGLVAWYARPKRRARTLLTTLKLRYIKISS